ncbi:unnamed protein product [Didymodactylos carnosus]|uniref:Hcy-binding domain-containing protein n=1 Tax=Didymodactylos carnosus TaxID=1234261 RepID=A0A8S2IRZ9_9BILA|nr:unnamed protein product [Didymodactylos carnosus]CAF3774614.1 unnamed protein product [Didymodactylos carnosus]
MWFLHLRVLYRTFKDAPSFQPKFTEPLEHRRSDRLNSVRNNTQQDTKSTAYGEPIEDAVNVCLKSKQIIAAGVNCVDPTLVEPIVERISNIDRDIIVYPNAGNTWNEKLR